MKYTLLWLISVRTIDPCLRVYSDTLDFEESGRYFCRQHFEKHFLPWKLFHLSDNFADVCYPVKNKSVLFQVLAWCRTCHKLLTINKSIIIQFTDAHMRQYSPNKWSQHHGTTTIIWFKALHYNDVIMSAMVSLITSLTIVSSTV